MHFIACEPSNILQFRVENAKAEIENQSSVRETNARPVSEPCTRMVDGYQQDAAVFNFKIICTRGKRARGKQDYTPASL